MRAWLRGVAVVGLLGLFIYLLGRVAPIALGDPDRYFHLALARETALSGKLWLKSIPQIAGLGWDLRYPDKEFLFHFLNRGIYELLGEAGIVQMVPVLASSIVLATLALLVRASSFWVGTGITLLGLVLDPYLIIRLGMLRPHLLAILFFVVLLHMMLRGSVLGAFILGMFYSWSYHSFYVPLLVLIIYAATEQFLRVDLKSPKLRVLAWGVLGLLTGLIVNPAFPGNLIMGFRHLVIALFEVSRTELDFGVELFPWSTEKFVRIYLPFCLLLVATPFVYKKRDHHFFWIWVTALVLFALAGRNPRALEYAVPAGLLLLALISRDFAVTRKKVTLLMLALFLSSIPRAVQVFAAFDRPVGTDEQVQKLIEALRRLPVPKAASGRFYDQIYDQIYNVEWDASPYIYYAQPGFQFVDILDPSFLHVYDRRHHDVRFTLRKGEVPDPWGVLQSLAKKEVRPRYLVTRYPLLIDQLGRDPHFKRVFPAPDAASEESHATRIYELSESRDPHFVTDYEGKVLFKSAPSASADALNAGISEKEWSNTVPLRSEHFHPTRIELGFDRGPVPSTYLDFRYGELAREWGTQATSRDGVTCVLLRPASQERKKQVGKTILALGGGRSLRVWLNGERFFRSVAASDSIDPMGRLVLLDRPLREKDLLEVVVCSKESAKTLGLTLSFWTQDEVELLCRNRGWKPPEGLKQATGWKRVGEYRETCFGSYVR